MKLVLGRFENPLGDPQPSDFIENVNRLRTNFGAK